MYQVDLYSYGPGQFIIYIVARVGNGSAALPLAVASGAESGRHLVASVEQVLRELRAPANRFPIQAEMQLAKACHPHLADKPSPVWLPEPAAVRTNIGFLEEEDDEPWDGLAEFPYLSTILMAGLNLTSYPAGDRRGFERRPLSTAYNSSSARYGAAIIDISSISDIRFCLFANRVTETANFDRRPRGYDYDSEEDEPHVDAPVLRVASTSQPLSAAEYVTQDEGHGIAGGIEWLQAIDESYSPLVQSALPSVCPSLARDVPVHQPQPAPRSLNQQAIHVLVQSTTTVRLLDPAQLHHMASVPGFQAALASELDSFPALLGPLPSAGQLLATAYADCTELTWAKHQHISYAAVAKALQDPALQSAETVSLCIDGFHDDPLPAVRALARLSNLRQAAFLSGPSRANDAATTTLFQAIASERPLHELLSRCCFVFAGIYSAGLMGKHWLPRDIDSFPRGTYPVQQMLLRRRAVNVLPKQSVAQPVLELYCLEEVLLLPEGFAAGFTNFLATRCRDPRLLAFSRACGLHSPGAAQNPTGPILAHTNISTIRNKPVDGSKDTDVSLQHYAPGAWTVLVDCDYHLLGDGYPCSCIHPIRYALIKPRSQVSVRNDSLADLSVADIDIVDLRGFLESTVVDARSLDEPFQDIPSVSFMAADLVASFLDNFL